MAGSPKKRNKKYVPKVDLHEKQIGQIYKSKGRKGLEDVYGKMKAPVPQYMEMQWDFLEAERILHMASLMHDKPIPIEELPLDIVKNVYKGDLIIAIVDQLIDSKQKYEITINTHLVKEGEEQIYSFKYHHAFDEAICYQEFMDGSKTHKVDRGQGIKTRWKGLSEEWCEAVQGKYPIDEFRLAGAQAKLSVNAPLLSWLQETNMRKTRFMNSIKLFI